MRLANMAAGHRTPLTKTQDDTLLDVSSLVDVCFLLLIYFIVTSTIVPQERDLGLGLPGAIRTERQPAFSPMAVRINDEGAVVAGSGDAQRVLDSDPDRRELPGLVSQLILYRDAARSASDTPSIQLHVDENVRQQRLIDVLNAFAAAGIGTVAFNDLKAL